MLQAAGEQTGGATVGDNLTQIGDFIFAGRNFKLDRGILQATDGNRLASRQNDIAVFDFDHTAVFDVRRDQYDVAVAAGMDVALILQITLTAAIKLELAIEEILIGNIQRRAEEAIGVDMRASSDQDAMLVDQEDSTVGIQITQNLTGVGAGDPIEYRAGRRGLDKISGLPRIDIE